MRRLVLRTNIGQSVGAALTVAGVAGAVSVSASDSADLVDPAETGTRAALSQTAIERSPVPVGTRGMEAVIASFPGFAVNANGAIHPRGAHNQMTYIVDGLPISDQLTVRRLARPRHRANHRAVHRQRSSRLRKQTIRGGADHHPIGAGRRAPIHRIQ
jgi:hypothetical protein